MTPFVIIAAVLTLLSVAALAWPLVARSQLPAAWKMAAGTSLAILVAVPLLYGTWSKWNWSVPEPAADSPAAMVGRLARRLEREPNDLQGWLMLGRSYAVIEQYPLAARAYSRADRLAGGSNVDALTGMAEALVLSNQGGLDGKPGRLFEQALQIDPASTKALFYSAIAAMERREFPLAKERFVRLLEGSPPPEVRRLIEEQILALDSPAAQLASATPAAGGAAAPAAPAAADASVVEVPLRITLAAGVAGRADAGAPLFILARVPGQRGPPLAARRLTATFPQDVELRSTDAMIAGSGFTAGQELEIEARVANGGSAISRSGDPFGTALIRAGSKERITIDINQVKP